MTPTAASAPHFGVDAIPHYFTIDTDGVLTAEMLGSGSDVEGKLKKLVAKAVAATPPPVTLSETKTFRTSHSLLRLAIPPRQVASNKENRPAKQVRDQRWLNQYSLNRDSVRRYGSVCSPPVRNA